MKRFIACLAFAALAAPAFAQQSSTLQELTTKGMVMEAGGMQIEVTYKPDGTFTAMDDQVTGKWRIDGDKLCTSSNFSPAEECVAYPTGKKSGDSFEVTGAQGTATIRIK
jgi:hypothetical protein